VIEDLVDVNYGIDEPAPVIKFETETDKRYAVADLAARSPSERVSRSVMGHHGDDVARFATTTRHLFAGRWCFLTSIARPDDRPELTCHTV
jgi:hypothetical protein